MLLPPASQERPSAAAAQAEPEHAASGPPLHGRVLLVEDQPIVACYMQDLLQAWGLAVSVEQDPLAAAARLALPMEREPFELLLTDQTMPGMTGLALAREARRQRPGLPVLLYTGNAAEIAEDDLAQSGVATLLRKPIDAFALRRLLQEMLERTG